MLLIALRGVGRVGGRSSGVVGRASPLVPVGAPFVVAVVVPMGGRVRALLCVAFRVFRRSRVLRCVLCGLRVCGRCSGWSHANLSDGSFSQADFACLSKTLRRAASCCCGLSTRCCRGSFRLCHETGEAHVRLSTHCWWFGTLATEFSSTCLSDGSLSLGDLVCLSEPRCATSCCCGLSSIRCLGVRRDCDVTRTCVSDGFFLQSDLVCRPKTLMCATSRPDVVRCTARL